LHADPPSDLTSHGDHGIRINCPSPYYDGKRFTGNCVGVDPESGLILQLDRGGRRMFDAAHTHTVR